MLSDGDGDDDDDDGGTTASDAAGGDDDDDEMDEVFSAIYSMKLLPLVWTKVGFKPAPTKAGTKTDRKNRPVPKQRASETSVVASSLVANDGCSVRGIQQWIPDSSELEHSDDITPELGRIHPIVEVSTNVRYKGLAMKKDHPTKNDPFVATTKIVYSAPY
jgi:hypothetical protein